MADFQQCGSITTLHRLQPDRLESLENELRRFAERKRVTLVLPALITEFERPAMRRICDELRSVSYLDRIVVAVGRASHDQVRETWEFFHGFESPVTILWIEDPRVQRLLGILEANGMPAGLDGKGRTCWLSFGYVLALGSSDVVAVHDCDIVNYSRDLLARLCYPVMHPGLGFEFCKGYYPRTSDRLHGRVTRLLVTPLLRALRHFASASPLIGFLEDFRYALAGEFAIDSSLLWRVRLQADWGLEIGLLSEVHRYSCPGRISQCDLADNYEHKHQSMSDDNPSAGLRRMAADVACTLLRCLAAEGSVLSGKELRRLTWLYQRIAEDAIDSYAADAAINDFVYPRHDEELAVQSFGHSLGEAVERFASTLANPGILPSWNRVRSAMPSFLRELAECGLEQPRRAPIAVFPHYEESLCIRK